MGPCDISCISEALVSALGHEVSLPHGLMAIPQETVVQLLMSHHLRLRAYAWLLVRDDHLADDLVQEVALIAIRKAGTIVDTEHFFPWARQTCRHVASNQLRREDRQASVFGQQILDVVEDKWDSPSLSNSNSIDALRACIDKLTPYAQNLLRLRYQDDLKSSEIAKQLGRSVETVYVAITRAHRALGECVRNRLAQEATYE